MTHSMDTSATMTRLKEAACRDEQLRAFFLAADLVYIGTMESSSKGTIALANDMTLVPPATFCFELNNLSLEKLLWQLDEKRNTYQRPDVTAMHPIDSQSNADND